MSGHFACKAMAIALALSTAVPAQAVPFSAASSGIATAASDMSAIAQVQHRRGGPRPGPGPGPRHHGGHRGGGGDGAAVAAGILGGLLLGAIIADQARQQRSVEYCMRRYRSYDPYSRTYLGYDGRRHPCP